MTEPCEKCGGHGWLWAKELDKYHGDPAELAFDDTRYDCDACDSPRMPVSAARRPKAEERTEPEARHHELVKAVEEVVRVYDGMEDGNGDPCPTLDTLRSALSNMGED